MPAFQTHRQTLRGRPTNSNFQRRQRYSVKIQRKEALRNDKLIGKRAIIALLLLQSIKRSKKYMIPEGETDAANFQLQAKDIKGILLKMTTLLPPSLRNLFARNCLGAGAFFSKYKMVPVKFLFIYLNDKLDLDDVKWDQISVGPDDKTAFNAVQNISQVLSLLCLVSATAFLCVGQPHVAACLTSVGELADCVGNSCTVANAAIRGYNHMSGRHVMNTKNITRRALNAAGVLAPNTMLATAANKLGEVNNVKNLVEAFNKATKRNEAVVEE